jgi:cation diffusion facilitator CzcD-associated flavoprotein CzcO
MAQGDFPSKYAAPENDQGWRSQKPIHEERHLKVICIGAGASGLQLAYKLQRSFENFDLIVYEKNVDLGGTWLENKYPGCVSSPALYHPVTNPNIRCACDIAAHIYTWSFEPNPTWSSMYAGSDEISQYFQNFTQKYGLAKYCKFNHQVSRAAWNTKMGRWDVEVTNLAEGTTILDSCDFLINAGGVLNSWRWPDIPGLKDFKGVLLHTARWDPTVDLSGKHVGLIGNG